MIDLYLKKNFSKSRKSEDITADHFYCRSFSRGDFASILANNMNVFLFVLKGAVSIRGSDNAIIVHNDMFVTFPLMDPIDIEFIEDTELLLFYYNEPTSFSATRILQNMKTKIINESLCNGYTLEQNNHIKQYLELLKIYILSNNECMDLYNLKKEELFILIKSLYKDEDLAYFFYPILKSACSFRKYILDQHVNYTNVAGLMKGLNMSKTVFYEKFKDTFGVSAKQWLILRLKERMAKRAKDDIVSAKDLMIEFNFSSPQHLNTFCKKQFGMTPSMLLNESKQYRF